MNNPDTSPVDEFHGMGGSYILDVKTGKRRRVEGSEQGAAPPVPPAAEDPAPSAEVPAPSDEKPKSRNRNGA